MGNRVKLEAYRTAGRPISVAIDPDATEGAVVGTNLTLSTSVTLPTGVILPAGYVLTAQDILTAFATELPPVNTPIGADWSQIQNIPANVREAAELSGASFIVRKQDGNWVTTTAWVVVQTKSDLPAPIAGVITLVSGVAYWFLGVIDLLGDRIVCGTSNVLMGQAAGTTVLMSTGLVGTLLTSTASLSIANITINVPTGTAFNFNDGAAGTLRFDGVTVANAATLGTMANYGNIVITECIFSECANLTIDGTIASFVSETCLWDGRAGQTTIIVPATAVITRRFRMLYTAFTVNPGETGINFNAAATVPDESYILDNVAFTGGGTYLAGLDYTSNKSAFFRNNGITNSSAICQFYMTANATATVIAVAGTFVKVAGTTTAGTLNQKFTTATTQRATYAGAVTESFRIVTFATMTSGNNQTLRMQIAKNGVVQVDSTARFKTTGSGDASSIGTQAFVTLAPGDYVELWATNDTAANNITVTDMNFTVTRIN
jgi:hypothetical protein